MKERVPSPPPIRDQIRRSVDRVTLDEDDPKRRTRIRWWIDANWFKLYIATFLVLLVASFPIADRYGDFAGGIVFWADLASLPGAVAAYAIHWRLYTPPGVLLDVEHPDGSTSDRLWGNRDALKGTRFVCGYPSRKATSNGNPVLKGRRFVESGETRRVKVEHTRDGGRYEDVEGPAIVGVQDEFPEVGELTTMRDRRIAEIYAKFEPAVRRAENIVEDVNAIIADETYRGIHIVAEGLSDNLDDTVSSALDDVAAEDYRERFTETLDWRDTEPSEQRDALAAPKAYANGEQGESGE